MQSRRDWERIQILGTLPGDATVTQSITVSQLSRGGALIETTFPLQLNSLHEFRLALGSLSVIVKGRVVHCAISDVESDAVSYRAGIEFVEMPVWVQTALGEFLDSLRAGRQA